ncbi:hypothetical protein F5X97DRAFT_302450 [Nemania serpens]|nr:hypothetical protein F5X97DRAFT_302450 [Nemania serpens]
MANHSAIASTPKCGNMTMPEQSLSTTKPRITVTTTISYSVTDSEEYTGTETVTVTPYVTITKTTTVTPSSELYTSVVGNTVTKTGLSPSMVTVTVYVTQPLITEAQTGAVGVSASITDITVSEPVTATVVQTIFPVPVGASTTKCTEAVVTESSSVASGPYSFITVVTVFSTSTTPVSYGSLISTPGASPETSPATTTATYEVAGTSASVDTTCTTPSAVVHSTSTTDLVYITAMTPLSAYTPHSVSDTVFWSVGFINITRTVTVPSGHVTTAPHPDMTRVPISSGAGPNKKPPSALSWGDNNGGGSYSCVVMLVAIVSLVLQLLLI